MKHKPASAAILEPLVESPQDLYWMGFDAYVNRLPLEYCHTEYERRGWLAANKADAEMGISGYAQKRGW